MDDTHFDMLGETWEVHMLFLSNSVARPVLSAAENASLLKAEWG